MKKILRKEKMRAFEFIRSGAELDIHIKPNETIESEFLDFKHMVDFEDKTDEKIKDAAIDLASFANNLGGNLIIGISERRNEGNLKVAGKYIGISDLEKYRVFYETAVKQWLYPSSLEYSLNYIRYSDETNLITINVYPLKNHLCAVSRPGLREVIYPIRTAYGNRFLSPFEIEERMNTDDRGAKIAIMKNWKGARLDLKIHSEVTTDNPLSIFRDRNNKANYISEVNEDGFVLSFNGNSTVILPFSFVSEFWKIGQDYFGIYLKCRIHLKDNPQKIELIFQ